MNRVELDQILSEADEAYFNGGEPTMSDRDYDLLRDRVSKLVASTGDAAVKVGILPPPLKRINLPVPMASLNKCNDAKSLGGFLKKWNDDARFVFQEKLDGVSCLYVRRNNIVELYTRGDGTVGTNITDLIDVGVKFPKEATMGDVTVRGELIISREIFSRLFSKRYKNARNMISGQISTKTPDASILRHVDFVAYELIDSSVLQKSVVDQFAILKRYGFKVVNSTRSMSKKRVNVTTLTAHLERRKLDGEYDMDGLVLTAVEPYERSNVLENPKYSTAFKLTGETAETTVAVVEWNLSKNGKYKPRVLIEPTPLNGVTVSAVTGFNAKYVLDHGIVPGTVLTITRSGDVIPHILKVERCPDAEVVKLPENSRFKGVDLYHSEQVDPDDVLIKQMTYFFSSLGCVHCRDKTIRKFFNGGLKTVEAVIREAASVESPTLTEQVGAKVALKISASIVKKVRSCSLHELLAAMNAFGEGIGLKKIQNINLDAFDPSTPIRGLSGATVKEKIAPVWRLRVERAIAIKNIVGGGAAEMNTFAASTRRFDGLSFAFTGFRDRPLENAIVREGGSVSSAVSKNTSYLVVTDPRKQSAKTKRAYDLGVTIVTKNDLVKMMSGSMDQSS